MLPLHAAAHPRWHLGELVYDIQSHRESVGRQQTARVKDQIESKLKICSVFESFHAERKDRRRWLQVCGQGLRVVPDPLLPTTMPFVLRALPIYTDWHYVFAVFEHDFETEMSH